jgi:hypothetical protein
MDRGVWATWYDLPEDGADEFISWLHGTYLPALQSHPGISWAAHYKNRGGGEGMTEVQKNIIEYGDDENLGRGTQYVMIVGAPSPHIFFQADAAWRPENQDDSVKAMLGRRTGVRTVVLAEEERINGPEYDKRAPGGTPGPAIQFGNFRMKKFEDEMMLGSWYAQYRFPFMARMPGSIATRKYLAPSGWIKHAIMYEFTSLEARLKHFEEPHEGLALDEKEWTGKIVRSTLHAPGSPTIAVRIWPEVTADGR